MKRRRNLLGLGILIMLAAACTLLYLSPSLPERLLRRVTSSPDGAYYETQSTLMQDYKPAATQPIIFLGDSHLAMVQWHEFMACPAMLNRGINGDGTEGVLRRLPGILELKPRQVVLMIGINDLAGKGRQASATLQTYTEIVNQLKAANIPVVLHKVLPIRYQPAFNEAINELNTGIIALGSTTGYPVIDLYPQLVKDGTLAAELTYDGLHLNAAAYQIWKSELQKVVNCPEAH